MSDGYKYTVKDGDKGLTYLFLDKAKQEGFKGSVDEIDWNKVMSVFDEIQSEKQKNGNESLFSGGTDKTKKGWGKSYVIHKNDALSVTDDQLNKIYNAMGFKKEPEKKVEVPAPAPASDPAPVVSAPKSEPIPDPAPAPAPTPPPVKNSESAEEKQDRLWSTVTGRKSNKGSEVKQSTESVDARQDRLWTTVTGRSPIKKVEQKVDSAPPVPTAPAEPSTVPAPVVKPAVAGDALKVVEDKPAVPASASTVPQVTATSAEPANLPVSPPVVPPVASKTAPVVPPVASEPAPVPASAPQPPTVAVPAPAVNPVVQDSVPKAVVPVVPPTPPVPSVKPAVTDTVPKAVAPTAPAPVVENNNSFNELKTGAIKGRYQIIADSNSQGFKLVKDVETIGRPEAQQYFQSRLYTAKTEQWSIRGLTGADLYLLQSKADSVATGLSVNTAIYSDLIAKQKSGTKLSDAERKFLQAHLAELSQYGLKLDGNNKIVEIPKN